MKKFLYRFYEKIQNEKLLILLTTITILQIFNSNYFLKNHFNRKINLPIPKYFKEWRKNFIEINQSTDKTGLVQSIFLGETSLLGEDEKEIFRQAGLTHLLAASGFNCWIVAIFLTRFLQLILYILTFKIKSTHLLWIKSKISPAGKMLGAILFWLWTDQSAPITRSVLMISFVSIFAIIGFKVQFGRLLIVQYLISIIVIPKLWLSPSFQLTFGCLFGLVFIPQSIIKIDTHFKTSIMPKIQKNKILNYLLSSFSACIGTIPATVYFFGRINLMSLTTNWFAVPPVSFIIMPLGLIQIFLVEPFLNNKMTSFIALKIGMINALSAKILFLTIKTWINIVRPFINLDYSL